MFQFPIYRCELCGKIEPLPKLSWVKEYGYICAECYKELYS